jgi:hypothetical protein
VSGFVLRVSRAFKFVIKSVKIKGMTKNSDLNYIKFVRLPQENSTSNKQGTKRENIDAELSSADELPR